VLGYRNVRSFSPRVTKLLFGALVAVGSLTAAAGVVFATSQPAPAVQPTSCPPVDTT
jgi:hypothetical protein